MGSEMCIRDRIGLIVPASILGAADAVDLRRTVGDSHRVSALWIDAKQSFDAAVDVAALVLTSKALSGNDSAGMTAVWLDGEVTSTPTPGAETWAPLLAAADAAPLVELPIQNGVVEDVASLTAGFRQHFYGIAEAVAEAADVAPSREVPALVTSGAIDPVSYTHLTLPTILRV